MMMTLFMYNDKGSGLWYTTAFAEINILVINL